jgi:hypothetical protein
VATSEVINKRSNNPNGVSRTRTRHNSFWCVHNIKLEIPAIGGTTSAYISQFLNRRTHECTFLSFNIDTESRNWVECALWGECVIHVVSFRFCCKKLIKTYPPAILVTDYSAASAPVPPVAHLWEPNPRVQANLLLEWNRRWRVNQRIEQMFTKVYVPWAYLCTDYVFLCKVKVKLSLCLTN